MILAWVVGGAIGAAWGVGILAQLLPWSIPVDDNTWFLIGGAGGYLAAGKGGVQVLAKMVVGAVLAVVVWGLVPDLLGSSVEIPDLGLSNDVVAMLGAAGGYFAKSGGRSRSRR
jgi:lipid-A-disaccharide synthase-like uncharacterized protein